MTNSSLTGDRTGVPRRAPGAAGDAPRPPLETQGGRRGMRPRTRSAIVTWAFILPAAVYLLVFFGYPIVSNLTMSFQDFTTATFFTGEAPWVGFDNYVAVVGSGLFAKLTANTAIFTIVSLTVTFLIGLGLALFFNRYFPLNKVLRALLLLPWLLPLIISSAVWRRMMEGETGILNVVLEGLGLSGVSWLTNPDIALYSIIIVNIWVGIPFVMVIIYGGLQEIPKDYYEAASLDGATGWRSFASITWPLLRPVVVVVLMLGFIYTIRVLDIILALTGGGPANATETYASRAYHLSFVNFEFGRGAALSNILIIVSLIVAAFQLRANKRASDLAG
ncbi:carbohydrate ABC transporter permease [Naasia sp. SYSU D00057]|uniref:carbohydrate ABC transporter permease n=1 Tax=Naasia sp. SYSU D00057 TaxID=2817380 RepID=UPI0035A8792C